jgi:hypothetical protein
MCKNGDGSLTNVCHVDNGHGKMRTDVMGTCENIIAVDRVH